MGMLEATRSCVSGARWPVAGSFEACGMKLRGLKSGVTTGQSASRTPWGAPTTGQPARAGECSVSERLLLGHERVRYAAGPSASHKAQQWHSIAHRLRKPHMCACSHKHGDPISTCLLHCTHPNGSQHTQSNICANSFVRSWQSMHLQAQ